MQDELSFRPEDPNQVSIHNNHEVEYWCYQFNCRPEELMDAYLSVGSEPEQVKNYIQILKGQRYDAGNNQAD